MEIRKAAGALGDMWRIRPGKLGGDLAERLGTVYRGGRQATQQALRIAMGFGIDRGPMAHALIADDRRVERARRRAQ